MDYRISETAQGIEIDFIGSFTVADHNRFFDIISLIKNSNERVLTFNFSKCDFVDSSALSMLIIANDEACLRDIALVIRGATGKARSIMLGAKFDNFYTFKD